MAEELKPASDDPFAQPVELPDEENEPSASLKQSPKKSKKLFKIILFIIVLAIAGFVAWKFFFADKNTPAPQPQTQDTQNQTAQEPTNDIAPAGELKTYDNGFLRITLKHPEAWTVTEKDNGVRLESPTFTYETMTGTSNGNFRIYIRKGAREQDSKYIGQAVVIRPTEKLKYTNPTAAQRKETNLSFFGYGDQTNFAFFMITGNFVLDNGDTLGPEYGKEADAYIIAGGYSQRSLEDDLQFNKVSPEGFDQTEAYAQAVNILESLELR